MAGGLFVAWKKILLIEPCGIEIAVWRARNESGDVLLIEPCGIEMNWEIVEKRKSTPTFNRTLWNWNLSA